jgi:hypothetical protein
MTERWAVERDIRNSRIAFRESRIVGEGLLVEGKISWEAFSLFMIAFEDKLRQLGDDF